jgi:hypothetical protein
MSLDDFKEGWKATEESNSGQSMDRNTLQKIYKSRLKQHLREPFRYFWASLAMQILLYAMMSHVIVLNWGHSAIMTYCIIGIVLYLPFTMMLLGKFRQAARGSIRQDDAGSMFLYVSNKFEQLQSFFIFKRRYELVQIPISCALGVILPFELYMPGGAQSYPNAMTVLFILALGVCGATISRENEKSFRRPLREMSELIAEFKS